MNKYLRGSSLFVCVLFVSTFSIKANAHIVGNRHASGAVLKPRWVTHAVQKRRPAYAAVHGRFAVNADLKYRRLYGLTTKVRHDRRRIHRKPTYYRLVINLNRRF